MGEVAPARPSLSSTPSEWNSMAAAYSPRLSINIGTLLWRWSESDISETNACCKFNLTLVLPSVTLGVHHVESFITSFRSSWEIVMGILCLGVSYSEETERCADANRRAPMACLCDRRVSQPHGCVTRLSCLEEQPAEGQWHFNAP